MAMIQCPDCGQEISDKAKKCVNCGKILVEEQNHKFCSECGKEISPDSKECEFCGCPVAESGNQSSANKLIKIIKKHKRVIIIAGAVLVACVICLLIISFMGSVLNDDEQLAYQNAVEMQSMMKDPDSFRLYDEMFLLKHYNENGENDYTYTIFKYGGANGYGAITTDEAIFKDGKYIMDYADEPDKEDSDYIEQLIVKTDISLYSLTGDNEKWKMVDIDIEKIKNKMGLK